MSAVLRHWWTVACLFVAIAITGCATKIYAPAMRNLPPNEPFRNFGQFQLQPVTLNPAFGEYGYNRSATASIDSSLRESLAGDLASWDKGGGRTLMIEPYVDEIKFIGGAARFWAGPVPGNSAVVMRVTYKDAASGAVIATPVFYQHANAMGGSFSFGGTDNAMLSRIAHLITDYTRNNYASAVGGPTGAPEDRVRSGG